MEYSVQGGVGIGVGVAEAQTVLSESNSVIASGYQHVDRIPDVVLFVGISGRGLQIGSRYTQVMSAGV